MLDFSALKRDQISIRELVDRENVTQDDLRTLTNEMIDRELALIADAKDADVTFVPSDPNANDAYASNPDEVGLSWTLGHVVVHATASSEEAAFVAAEIARGVTWRGGRARYEVPWEQVTTIQECRDRLEESRKMRLASLDLWPQPPHLENTFEARAGLMHNCISRFVAGLSHDDAHLGQIENIVAQAQQARTTA